MRATYTLFKHVLLLAFLFAAVPLMAANYYVSPDGDDTNNGSSWEKAFKTVYKAVVAAPSGSVIYIAGGATYEVTQTLPLKTNIVIQGGYTTANVYDPANSPTILSGGNGTYSFLSQDKNYMDYYSLISDIIFDGGGSSTSGGAANVKQGVIFNRCTFRNCSTNTSTAHGGAVYAYGNTSENDIFFINCVFYANRAGGNGGAVFARYATFMNCLIFNNSAARGGPLYLERSVLYNCTILNNSNALYFATSKGSCFMYNSIVYNNGTDDPNMQIGFDSNSGYLTAQNTYPVSVTKTPLFQNIPTFYGVPTSAAQSLELLTANFRQISTSPLISGSSLISYTVASFTVANSPDLARVLRPQTIDGKKIASLGAYQYFTAALPTLSLACDHAYVQSGQTLALTASLSAFPDSSGSAVYTFSDAAGNFIDSGMLNFVSQGAVLSNTFTLTAPAVTADTYMYVSLSDPVNVALPEADFPIIVTTQAPANYNLLSYASLSATVTEPETTAAPVVVTATLNLAQPVSEGISFPITLSGGATQIANTYTLSSTAFTFTAGSKSASVQITVKNNDQYSPTLDLNLAVILSPTQLQTYLIDPQFATYTLSILNINSMGDLAILNTESEVVPTSQNVAIKLQTIVANAPYEIQFKSSSPKKFALGTAYNVTYADGTVIEPDGKDYSLTVPAYTAEMTLYLSPIPRGIPGEKNQKITFQIYGTDDYAVNNKAKKKVVTFFDDNPLAYNTVYTAVYAPDDPFFPVIDTLYLPVLDGVTAYDPSLTANLTLGISEPLPGYVQLLDTCFAVYLNQIDPAVREKGLCAHVPYTVADAGRGTTQAEAYVYIGAPVSRTVSYTLTAQAVSAALGEPFAAFTKKPSVYAEYYKPFKDDIRAKKTSKTNLKLTEKITADSPLLTLYPFLNTAINLVNKSVRKNADHKYYFFADLQNLETVMKPALGLENYVKVKNAAKKNVEVAVGAMILVPPHADTYRVLRNVENGEYVLEIRGGYFGSKLKAQLEYQTLSNGKLSSVKALNLSALSVSEKKPVTLETLDKTQRLILSSNVYAPDENGTAYFKLPKKYPANVNADRFDLVIDSGCGANALPRVSLPR